MAGKRAADKLGSMVVRVPEREVLLAFVLGLLVTGVPLIIAYHVLSSQIVELEDEVASFTGWTLTTDRRTYRLGENITITFENSFDKEMFAFSVPTFIVEKRNVTWEAVYDYVLPEYLKECGMIGIPVCFPVSVDETLCIIWNQTMLHCDWSGGGTITSEQASVGEYRIKMIIAFRYDVLEFLEPEEMVTLYSNEFTITS